jgi:hypothetical protein
VYVSGNSVNIDAIQIYAQADGIEPNAVNLAAEAGATSGTVTLKWKAVGDDKNLGKAASYLVRYSASAAIDSDSAWANATPVTTGIPTPQAAGADESMTLKGLEPGKTYYFAIRVQDEQFNVSGLSNSPSTAAKLFPPVIAGSYDDTAPEWNYSETWIAWTGSGPANNTEHYTGIINSSAELTFIGTKFILTYVKSSNRGSIRVYVDELEIGTINAYNASQVYGATWSSPTLTPTPGDVHTVRFVHAGPSGTYIDIDAIQILSP